MRPEPDDLGNWFQPVSEALMADPVAGPMLRQLAQDDPDLIAAVADVDRSQVRDMLALTPEQRLVHASRMARALEGYRRVGGAVHLAALDEQRKRTLCGKAA